MSSNTNYLGKLPSFIWYTRAEMRRKRYSLLRGCVLPYGRRGSRSTYYTIVIFLPSGNKEFPILKKCRSYYD